MLISISGYSQEVIEESREISSMIDIPILSLKSIYRFGSEYRITLDDEQGVTLQVTWKDGQNLNKPVILGYEIYDADSESVTLTMPDGVDCYRNYNNCISENQVLLPLTQPDPISLDEVAFVRDSANVNIRYNGEEVREAFEKLAQASPEERKALEQDLREKLGFEDYDGGSSSFKVLDLNID